MLRDTTTDIWVLYMRIANMSSSRDVYIGICRYSGVEVYGKTRDFHTGRLLFVVVIGIREY